MLAAARPDHNVLALEVWLPGVADSLWRVAEAGADNVRFCSVDAVWTLENLLGPASLAELWTFFPDPWRKTKHRKRRLVNPANAALASSRLVPGGAWRLATDWADYADQMREVLDAEPTLEGGRGGAVGRAAGDPLRAQGPRRRPRHRRLLLPPVRPGLIEHQARLAQQVLEPQPLGLAVGALAQVGEQVRHPEARAAWPSRSSYAAVVPRRRAIGVPGAGASTQRPDAAQGGRELLDRRDRRLRRGRGEVRAHAPDGRARPSRPSSDGRSARGRRKGPARAPPVGRPRAPERRLATSSGTSAAGHGLHRHCDLAWACGVCQDVPVAPAGRRGAAHLDF